MKLPLRTLLIVPFLCQVLGITGLVGYLSYRSGQRAVKDMVSQLMAETGQEVAAKLETTLQAPRLLTQVNAQLMASEDVGWQDLTQVEQHFLDQIQLFPQITGLVMTDPSGAFLNVARLNRQTAIIRRRNITVKDNVLYRYRQSFDGQRLSLLDTRTDFDPHRDPPDDPWYPAAQHTPEGFWRLVVALHRGQDQPLMAIVRFLPVYSSDHEFKGVVSTGILLPQISQVLQELMVDRQGQIVLLEPNGKLIATSTGELPFSNEVFESSARHVSVRYRQLAWYQSDSVLTRAAVQQVVTQQPLSQLQSPYFSEFRLGSQHYFVQATPLQGEMDWLVVTAVPSSEFMAAIQANLARTVLLCTLALLGAIGLGIWATAAITKPILSLQQAAQAFTDGRTVIPPTQGSHIQEVDSLRQTFNQMVEQLVITFQILHDRENTLATFLNGIPVAVSVHDSSGRMLFLNAKGQEILPQGLTPAPLDQLSQVYSLYRANTDELYPTDQLPVAKGLRGETAYTNDIEVKRDGVRIPLEVHTIPVVDDEGKILYCINAFQDITERRQAEMLQANYERELEQRVTVQMASLAKGEVTKQALINAIPDLLVRLGRDGMPIEIYNLDAVHWIGDKSKAYQLSMFEGLPLDIATARQQCIDLALATGQVQRHEYEFKIDGQTYYEEARIVPVTEDEVLVVVRDISERRKIDRLKDEFIAIVSHELRTPLTAIRGALGILDTGVLQDRPEKAQHMLKMSLLNTERLIRLVNDILDLERLSSGKVKLVKEVCSVAELMQLGLNGVEAIALESRISLHHTPLQATVWAAPDAIVQTLTNLLGNAIKFSPPDSQVWLSAQRVAPECQPPSVRFAITDQGRGIPADRLTTIFDRFQQVDVSDSRQRGGTGLGLAICKGIVEQHGGEIWVESVLGQGSTFYFTLPTQPYE